MKSREVRFARRPEGRIEPGNFELAETTVPDPAEGEVVVRNLWMSVDPYMRLPLTLQHGTQSGRQIGETMVGAAVGRVVRSRAPSLPEGAVVYSPSMGWREAYVAEAGTVQAVDPDVGSLSWYVGILGLTGVTAYAGIEYVLKPQAGESLYISGAAGAVGSVACQLAKLRGARVLGTAGSDEKVAWLTGGLGIDAAANYKTVEVADFLREQSPEGLDAYFDNVAGPTLDAALAALKVFGRAGLCGAISQYDSENYRAGPRDFFTIIEKGLSITGFNARIFAHRRDEILATLKGMLADGRLHWRESITDGIENATASFVSLFDGSSVGKTVVRLSD